MQTRWLTEKFNVSRIQVGRHWVDITENHPFAGCYAMLLIDTPPFTIHGDDRKHSIDKTVCRLSQFIEDLQAIKKALEAEYQRSLK